MHQLSDRERPHRRERIGFGRRVPVPGHRGAERFEIEHEIRMAGGDHFVIDELVGGAQMTRQTDLRTADEILRIEHARLDGLGVRPPLGRMRTEPRAGGTMTRFAAHAFTHKRPRLLRFRRIERVAGQTFRRIVGRGQSQEAGHAHRDGIGQHLRRPRMPILRDPRRVLGLENAAAAGWTDGPVTRGRRARSRPGVGAGHGRLRGQRPVFTKASPRRGGG
jgi:hypothetical protein